MLGRMVAGFCLFLIIYLFFFSLLKTGIKSSNFTSRWNRSILRLMNEIRKQCSIFPTFSRKIPLATGLIWTQLAYFISKHSFWSIALKVNGNLYWKKCFKVSILGWFLQYLKLLLLNYFPFKWFLTKWLSR